MFIAEKFIMGKNSDVNLCEDGLYIDDSFIAVIDGVTAKSNRLFHGKKGGRAAMECVIDTLKDAPHNITAVLLFDIINQNLAKLYDGEPTGEAAACIIIYSAFHKEIWCMGDCQCLINGTPHSHEKLIDKELSEKRSRVIKDALDKGTPYTELLKNDIGRQAIMPILSTQHIYANRSDHYYGYPVLNGTPFSENSITVYRVLPGDFIVLASDGYPKLFPTLQESENYLQHIIKTDPLCFKEYKSTKGITEGNTSFDDRAYISFKVQ